MHTGTYFKKYLLAIFVAALLCAAGRAPAAPMTCSFVAGSSSDSIAFGNIDPTAPAAPTITGTVVSQVTFTCSRNNAYTIAVTPASPYTLAFGANSMNYTLGVAASGTYAGAPVRVFPTGGSTIAPIDYQSQPAGTYANGTAINVSVAWAGLGSPITAILPIGSVSATVDNTCSITGSPALNFGVLDAVTNAGGTTAIVTPPVVMCTMNDSISVTEDYGANETGTQHRLKRALTSDYIDYNFTFTSPIIGAGGTTDIGGSGANRLSLSASIPASALASAPAGDYSDTIVLTFSF